jgi:hypothetical protein
LQPNRVRRLTSTPKHAKNPAKRPKNGLLSPSALGSSATPQANTDKLSLEHDSAIAQFTNGRFLLIALGGTIQDYDLGPQYFFMLARFSPDGRKVVCVSGRSVSVLNSALDRIFESPLPVRHLTAAALSNAGNHVAILGQDDRGGIISLHVMNPGEKDELVMTFPSTISPPNTLSWDPSGGRVLLRRRRTDPAIVKSLEAWLHHWSRRCCGCTKE